MRRRVCSAARRRRSSQPPTRFIVELGPGNGEKLAIARARSSRPSGGRVGLHLVDVSPAALEPRPARCAKIPARSCHDRCARRIEDGLARLARQRAGDWPRAACCFSGRISATSTPPRRRRLLRQIRARARARRCAAARARSRQAARASAARLRRSARRDGGVQPEPARPHEPELGANFDLERVRASGAVGPSERAHRDASREPRPADRATFRAPTAA